MTVWIFVVLISANLFAKDQPAPLAETLSGYSEALNSPAPAVRCDHAENFCRDPYTTICSDLSTHRDHQLARAEELGKKKTGSFYTSPRTSEIGAHTQTVIANLRQAIGASTLPEDSKAEFNVLLDRTRIVTASQIKKELFTSKFSATTSDTIEKEIYSACGGDLTSPKAFVNQTDDNDKRTLNPIVVICDGLLDTFPNTPEYDLTTRISMVVGHELSHVMSYEWRPQLYEKITSCMVGRSEGLVKEYVTELKKRDDWMDGDTEPTTQQLVGAEMEELSADYWARKAFVNLLKSQSDRSQESLLQKMRQAYAYFCGHPYGGTHPSGRVRIEFMANDKTVRELMGCAPSAPSTLSCDL
ncbi:MAG: hypothetical protein ACJ76H_09460 [Bacteriovoracaceae bacterium]